MTPETSAELAQIHYITAAAREWNSPIANACNEIKKGNVADGAALLASHIETMQHLHLRLSVLLVKATAVAA